MQRLVNNIKENLFSRDNTVSLERARLITEAYKKYSGEPVPVKRAKAFSYLLNNMTLDLESNPVFAGNTSPRPRAWMLVPEQGFKVDPQVEIENEELEGFLDDKIPYELEKFWRDISFGGGAGIGHLAVNMEKVLNIGLGSVIKEIQTQKNNRNSRKKDNYLKAMSIALKGVIDWSERYAEAAKDAAAREKDPLTKKCYQRVASACCRVPAKPARNMFEALQAMVLIQLAIFLEGHGMSVSLGLPDRYLAPFLKDCEWERNDMVSFIAAFILKLNACSLFGSASKTQAITVGGAGVSKEDMSNMITICFMEAFDFIRVGDPHLFLRWHPELADNVKEKAWKLLASGLSMPLLINDKPTVKGFIEAGIKPEDAYNYCVIGCNELGIPGKLMETATPQSGTIKYLELLNETLANYEKNKKLDKIKGIKEILDDIEEKIYSLGIKGRKRQKKHQVKSAEKVPTPYTSSLMEGCIQNGKDLRTGMVYHFPGLYDRGFTNTVNALAAIKYLVFDTKKFSFTQIMQSVRDNFKNKNIRNAILSAPSWGNDLNYVDQIALQLLKRREKVLKKVDQEFKDKSHFVCHVIRSLHHLDGRNMPATPDGRKAGDPLADSIGAQTGTVKNAATGILNSVLKIKAFRFYRGGYNLNLTLSDIDFSILGDLVETFFQKNGQEVQINVFNVETLKRASKNPEEYKDLIVRVAGFSSRFIDLSFSEQQELIERAEAFN
ncbi:MAG: pyruvate formate lyase family protein [Halanaerobiales bacterium]